MAYTAPSTHPNSYIVTSTDWAIQVNNDKFFHGVPTAKVGRAATQAIVTATYTAIAFSSKEWDSNSMFATTGTKVTCKTAGKFLVSFNSGFAASTAGSHNRIVGIRKNTTGAGEPDQGSDFRAYVMTAGQQVTGNITTQVSLSTGQFIEGVVFQDSGGNLNTSTQTDRRPKLSILWVSS